MTVLQLSKAEYAYVPRRATFGSRFQGPFLGPSCVEAKQKADNINSLSSILPSIHYDINAGTVIPPQFTYYINTYTVIHIGCVKMFPPITRADVGVAQCVSEVHGKSPGGNIVATRRRAAFAASLHLATFCCACGLATNPYFSNFI